MEKLDEIKLYIKQSQDELEGGIWDGDPLCLFTMLVDLQAENEELKERIELAVDYLPECPDKAKSFLEPLKGKDNGKEDGI